MIGVLNNHKTMYEIYLNSFKLHFKESVFGFTNGMLWVFTLHDIPVILTIIGITLGSVIMPFYYGRRRYRKQEEREQETALIKAIKDLRELGFIDKTTSQEEQRKIAEDWLIRPVANTV